MHEQGAEKQKKNWVENRSRARKPEGCRVRGGNLCRMIEKVSGQIQGTVNENDELKRSSLEVGMKWSLKEVQKGRVWCESAGWVLTDTGRRRLEVGRKNSSS